MSKDPKKEAMKKAWKAQENQKLLDSLPLSKNDLKDLFDYLDRPNPPPCDHTLRDTTKYLKVRNLDVEKIVPWLEEHGGYCDCEVIYNVENEFADLINRT